MRSLVPAVLLTLYLTADASDKVLPTVDDLQRICALLMNCSIASVVDVPLPTVQQIQRARTLVLNITENHPLLNDTEDRLVLSDSQTEQITEALRSLNYFPASNFSSLEAEAVLLGNDVAGYVVQNLPLGLNHIQENLLVQLLENINENPSAYNDWLQEQVAEKILRFANSLNVASYDTHSELLGPLIVLLSKLNHPRTRFVSSQINLVHKLEYASLHSPACFIMQQPDLAISMVELELKICPNPTDQQKDFIIKVLNLIVAKYQEFTDLEEMDTIADSLLAYVTRQMYPTPRQTKLINAVIDFIHWVQPTVTDQMQNYIGTLWKYFYNYHLTYQYQQTEITLKLLQFFLEMSPTLTDQQIENIIGLLKFYIYHPDHQNERSRLRDIVARFVTERLPLPIPDQYEKLVLQLLEYAETISPSAMFEEKELVSKMAKLVQQIHITFTNQQVKFLTGILKYLFKRIDYLTHRTKRRIRIKLEEHLLQVTNWPHTDEWKSLVIAVLEYGTELSAIITDEYLELARRLLSDDPHTPLSVIRAKLSYKLFALLSNHWPQLRNDQ